MKGGAPMACKRQDGSYALVGLLSWGIACNGEEAEVFTKVQSFSDWLKSKEKIN
jgi:trypsin